MAYKVTLRFKDVKEMRRTLDKIPSDIKDDAQEAAVVSAALLVANDAKRRAPIRTGTLRRSIHVGGHGNKTPEYQPTLDTPQLPKPFRERNTVIAYVGTNVEYAPYQEFGTSRIPARPYLRPAFDVNKDKIYQEMADVLTEFFEKYKA